jgi:two-component system, NtrC family, response regulator AtoC
VQDGEEKGVQNNRILLVDDDALIRSSLKSALADEGYTIDEAQSGKQALASVIELKPDLILMDVHLPDMSGLDVLERLKAAHKNLPVVFITAFGSSSTAIRGMQLGAFDYITKPFELDELFAVIEKALGRNHNGQNVAASLGEPLQSEPDNKIIGSSSRMLEVFRTIGRVADSDVTVLITGETGTGKELIAGAIHGHSSRRQEPYVKVACAALPESLLESELFGHEKGAFTSAITQHKGRFELADKGTIFLDEIAEMTLGTQKKLLRVLQEREFERVGGNQPIPVDVRVVAATNRRLEDEVEAGRFRQDLYYRINVMPIELPPLRARKDDVPRLIQYFLTKHRPGPRQPIPIISQDAVDTLLGHPWPGNVRELENVIERAIALSNGQIITAEHLRLTQLDTGRKGNGTVETNADASPSTLNLADAVSKSETETIIAALEKSRKDLPEAARLLGVTKSVLVTKMRQYRLNQ